MGLWVRNICVMNLSLSLSLSLSAPFPSLSLSLSHLSDTSMASPSPVACRCWEGSGFARVILRRALYAVKMSAFTFSSRSAQSKSVISRVM